MAFRVTATGFVVEPASGHAVANPALEGIVFEPTIGKWVTALFPEAQYTVHDTTRMAPVDLSRRGVIAIQGPKGLGKSKAIRAGIAALPEKTSAVQITFRRSLAWSANELLGAGATLYSSLPKGAISARQHPRLTIVVNSISRVSGVYDVVVIDELVSVIDMLASTLLNARNRVDAAHTLACLIGAARTVVVADAMLDATALDFVLLCRRLNSDYSRRGPPAAAELQVHDYIQRVHGDYVYYAHAAVETWMEVLNNALAAGRRVVVPCMTKAMANRLASIYSDRYATMCYTADVDPERLHAHMADIHTYWARAQLLIYSPVVSAGVSFELRHFDLVCFYGYVGLGSVRSAVQMIARVRDVADKTVHVFIGRAGHFSPLPDDGAPGPLRSTTPGTAASDTHMQLLSVLEDYRRVEDARAHAAFPYYFWSLIAHSGGTVAFQAAARAKDVPENVLETAAALAPADLDDESADASHEIWLAHNWAGPECSGIYELEQPVPLRGTLLQKARRLLWDHAVDTKLVQIENGVSFRSMPSTCADFVHECGGNEKADRIRYWCALLVAKAVMAPGLVRVPARAADGVPMATPTRPPRVIAVYPAAAAMWRQFAPVSLLTDTRPALRQYMRAEACWLEEGMGQAAWVLAGIWTAMLTHTPAGPMVMERAPDHVYAAVLRQVERLQDVLCRMRPVWVGVQVPLGRAKGMMGIADYVVLDTTNRWHILIDRSMVPSRGNTHTDLMKAAALAAALQRSPIGSVRVLYADGCIAAEQLNVDGLFAALDVGLAPAWCPDTHLLFGSVTHDNNVLMIEGIEHPITTMAELSAALGDHYKLVCWGFAGFVGLEDDDDDPILKRVRDIDTWLAVRLNVFPAPFVLDMSQARVVNACVSSVRQLYFAGMQKHVLVYFWNARPIGVSMRAVPDYACMQTLSTSVTA